MEHMIDIVDDQAIRLRCYPVSKKIEEEMHKRFDDLLQRGIIIRSSPVVMVKKTVCDEQGNISVKCRLCIDYRKLNQVSKSDAFCLPNLKLMQNKLQEAKIWTTIDLKMAYNKILVVPQNRHLTAFVVPGKGIFEFVTMPFGLKSAGATFQRAIS